MALLTWNDENIAGLGDRKSGWRFTFKLRARCALQFAQAAQEEWAGRIGGAAEGARISTSPGRIRATKRGRRRDGAVGIVDCIDTAAKLGMHAQISLYDAFISLSTGHPGAEADR